MTKEPITFMIVTADRPDASEEDLSWIAMIRRSLGECRQRIFDNCDFVECDTCAAKPGSPSLCAGCLANRHIITLLKKEISRGRSSQVVDLRQFKSGVGVKAVDLRRGMTIDVHGVRCTVDRIEVCIEDLVVVHFLDHHPLHARRHHEFLERW